VDGQAEAARTARERAEAELAKLQTRITPRQDEINQLARQFWVTKEQVAAQKYDLSASRMGTWAFSEEQREAALEVLSAAYFFALNRDSSRPSSGLHGFWS
jgi:hypothetical protein